MAAFSFAVQDRLLIASRFAVSYLAEGPISATHSDRKLENSHLEELGEKKMTELVDHHHNAE